MQSTPCNLTNRDGAKGLLTETDPEKNALSLLTDNRNSICRVSF